MIRSSSSAPSTPPAISGRRLIMSTFGVTPFGVATTTSWPASVRILYGFANSSAQYPVAYRVPSFITQYVAPLTMNSTLLRIALVVSGVTSVRLIIASRLGLLVGDDRTSGDRS